MNIEIFGKIIPVYGIFFWIGIFAAAGAAVFVCKKLGLPLFDLTCSAIYTLIAGIVGAKLFYIIVSFDDIIVFAKESGLAFFELVSVLIKGGFVFYGGVIGGMIGLFIYAKQFKMDFILLLRIYATVLPLGHAFGRIGCFFGGCCFGVPYEGFFSYTYKTVTGAAPVGMSLFPVQLLEAFLLLLLFILQVMLLIKFDNKKMLLIYNYVFSYAVIRFLLEFLRGDVARGKFLFLSTSQWISLGLCTAFLICAYILKNKNKEIKTYE